MIFDAEKPAFAILKDFKIVKILLKFHKNRPKNIIVGKSSPSSGQRLIIRLHILRGIYSLQNDSEQIYLFPHIYR